MARDRGGYQDLRSEDRAPRGDDLGPRREESPSGDGSALVRLPEYFVSRVGCPKPM